MTETAAGKTEEDGACKPSEKLVMMSFNMPLAWHTHFKMTAASRNISMKELLVECFECWQREHRDK